MTQLVGSIGEDDNVDNTTQHTSEIHARHMIYDVFQRNKSITSSIFHSEQQCIDISYRRGGGVC